MRYKIWFIEEIWIFQIPYSKPIFQKKNLVTSRAKYTTHKNLYMIPDRARHLYHRWNHFRFIFENVFGDVELYTNAKLISLIPALK